MRYASCMSQSPVPLVTHICVACGSDQVMREAWAAWDLTTQDWVLDTIFDYAYCQRCLAHRQMAQVAATDLTSFPADSMPQPAPPDG